MARLQAELDCRGSSSLRWSFTHAATVTVLMLMMHDDADHYLSRDHEANGVVLTILVTVRIVIVVITLVLTISVVVEIAVTQMSYNRLKIKDGFL